MDFIFHGLTGLVVSKGFAGSYSSSAVIFSCLPDIIQTVSTTLTYSTIEETSKPKSIKVFVRAWVKKSSQNEILNRSKF